MAPRCSRPTSRATPPRSVARWVRACVRSWHNRSERASWCAPRASKRAAARRKRASERAAAVPRAKRRQEPSAGDTSRRRSAHGATTRAKRRGQKWRRSACVVVVGVANDSSPAAASSRHDSFDATCHFTTARRDHPPSPLFPAEARARGWFAVAYFGPLVVVGGFVLPTVLIGIVSIAFDGAKTRCEADLREARMSRERGRSINSTARTSTERLARARESAARERVGTSWSIPFSPQNCPSHQYGRERTGWVLRYLG